MGSSVKKSNAPRVIRGGPLEDRLCDLQEEIWDLHSQGSDPEIAARIEKLEGEIEKEKAEIARVISMPDAIDHSFAEALKILGSEEILIGSRQGMSQETLITTWKRVMERLERKGQVSDFNSRLEQLSQDMGSFWGRDPVMTNNAPETLPLFAQWGPLGQSFQSPPTPRRKKRDKGKTKAAKQARKKNR